MKHPDGEIIEKAREEIIGRVEVDTDMIEITVDMEGEKGKMHTYLVSFKREKDGESWKAFDIAEV